MRGRKPNPHTLRILRGNPGKRSFTHSAPAPFVAGAPKKPDFLTPEGNAEWDRLVEQLGGPGGVLATCDGGILLVTVSAFEEFCQARSVILKHGRTYETINKDGGIMHRQRPEVRILERARRDYMLCLQELGATPAQHTRVHAVPEQQELDGIAKFFQGPH